MNTQIEILLAELSVLRAQNEHLVGLIKSVEWEAGEPWRVPAMCCWCQKGHNEGHAVDCAAFASDGTVKIGPLQRGDVQFPAD